MRNWWDFNPSSPLVLLDHWLEERGFVDRKQINSDAPEHIIQIFRPHSKEWLFSIAIDDLASIGLWIKIWGPGMLYKNLIQDFNLADPNSFDAVTSTISAWRKVKHATMNIVWRYINTLQHRIRISPTTNWEHWVAVMSDSYFKYHVLKDEYKRMATGLQVDGIELPK
jgi:hypothetical protein